MTTFFTKPPFCSTEYLDVIDYVDVNGCNVSRNICCMDEEVNRYDLYKLCEVDAYCVGDTSNHVGYYLLGLLGIFILLICVSCLNQRRDSVSHDETVV